MVMFTAGITASGAVITVVMIAHAVLVGPSLVEVALVEVALGEVPVAGASLVVRERIKQVAGESVLGASEPDGLATAQITMALSAALHRLKVTELEPQPVSLTRGPPPRPKPLPNGRFDVDAAAIAREGGDIALEANAIGAADGAAVMAIATVIATVVAVGGGRQGEREDGDGEGLVHGVLGLQPGRPAAGPAVNVNDDDIVCGGARLLEE